MINSFKFPNDSNLSKIQIHSSNQKASHQRTNSGPIIPDRSCIENVIKHTPGIFFGIGPHMDPQERVY